MAFSNIYRRQVALLIRVVPAIAGEPDFALKGGTAINLFVRDLPRLSIDIDLTYLPVATREQSLKAIDAGMKRIGRRIRQSIRGVRVHESQLNPEGVVTKLIVGVDGVQIKVEVTPVLRGSVFPPEMRAVTPAVEAAFGFAETQLVSHADLYAGKLVAALDRQHPRDLFDVRNLLAAEGISDDLRQAFIVYILSHGRPMAEVLAPTRQNLDQAFAREFEGMTSEPIGIEELVATREALIDTIVDQMPDAHRRFLVQFKRGEPDWSLLGLPEVADLPAVRWRQQNLDKLSPERRAALIAQLEEVLFEG